MMAGFVMFKLSLAIRYCKTYSVILNLLNTLGKQKVTLRKRKHAHVAGLLLQAGIAPGWVRLVAVALLGGSSTVLWGFPRISLCLQSGLNRGPSVMQPVSYRLPHSYHYSSGFLIPIPNRLSPLEGAV